MSGELPSEILRSHYPRRNRNSTFKRLNEAETNQSTTTSTRHTRSSETIPQAFPGEADGVRRIRIGFWKDPRSSDQKAKHPVTGFLDAGGRLRTSVQGFSAAGHQRSRWVTFEDIELLPHLEQFNHDKVKKYVRVLSHPIAKDPTTNATHADCLTTNREGGAATSVNQTTNTCLSKGNVGTRPEEIYQEASQRSDALDEPKTYGGVTYERKKKGMFPGQLASQGSLINIDGEDFVEYRVLIKIPVS